MTGAEAVIQALLKNNVEAVFGYPGASNLLIYEELRKSKINHYLVRTEQSAAHSANGYFRATGKVGVAMVTSGPGATNLITGIATAYGDSIPMVALTGQVSRNMIGTDAFQEVDITGAVSPFCKHTYLIEKTNDLANAINEAFHIAGSGRPGPVLIDIPSDVQAEEFTGTDVPVNIRGYKPTIRPNEMQVKRIAASLSKSTAPLLVCGGGVVTASCGQALLKLCEELKMPIVTTLMGLSAIPSTHELNLGMVGSHGSPSANWAVNNADLIVLASCRVADRAISSAARISEKATIIHIDIDPAEIGKNISCNHPVVGDVGLFIDSLYEKILLEDERSLNYHEQFMEQCRRHSSPSPQPTEKEGIDPKYAAWCLSQCTKEDAIVCTDVGQNQLHMARHYEIKTNSKLMTSGGLGTMGFALPCAIGAKIGAPNRQVIATCGDGGFMMTCQELATMVQWGTDVKMVLFNNNSLGLVDALQKSKCYGSYAVDLTGNPDFVKFAKSFNIDACRINQNNQLEQAFSQMLLHKGPYLLELVLSQF